MTPFDRPVLPDVKMVYMRSLGEASGCGYGAEFRSDNMGWETSMTERQGVPEKRWVWSGDTSSRLAFVSWMSSCSLSWGCDVSSAAKAPPAFKTASMAMMGMDDLCFRVSRAHKRECLGFCVMDLRASSPLE